MSVGTLDICQWMAYNGFISLYDKLGGVARTLLEQYGAVAHYAVNDVLGVVADGDELQPQIVAQTELWRETLTQLGKEHLIVVNTQRKTECRILHHIDPDIQLRECGKDGLEIVFCNETEIFGQHRKECLVVLYDVKRS